MKTRTNISIDPYLVEEAKKKGINISAVTEYALSKKIHLPEEEDKKEYPFEMCEKEIPDHLKKILFGCVAIKAKRCHSCHEVWFVNDPTGEFKICKDCFKK